MSIEEFAKVSHTAPISDKQKLEVFSYLSLSEEHRKSAPMSFPSKGREGCGINWHLILTATTPQLTDRNQTVYNESGADDYYITIGSYEFEHGVNCWQCKVNKLDGWVAFGICQKKAAYVGASNATFSYEDQSWRGWSHASQSFRHGKCEGGGITWGAHQHVHIRLDLSKHTLDIKCVESGATALEVDLPRRLKWVPGFIVRSGCSVTVRPIPPTSFGKVVSGPIALAS